jgi:hypothetical protein
MVLQPHWFQIGGMTIQVESDLPITDTTFCTSLRQFEVAQPGADTVFVRHHFGLPAMSVQELGRAVYRQAPWAVYERADAWIYQGISGSGGSFGSRLIQRLDRFRRLQAHQIAIWNRTHTCGDIYHPSARPFLDGDLHALTLFPTDQILIARLLADRAGCYLHSAGAILDGAGVLFVGPSGAGKTTTVRMLTQASEAREGTGQYAPSGPGVEILCDDRNIVRRVDGAFRVFGTWSHGESALVSPAHAPLRAIFFLDQARENRLALLTDRSEIRRRLLARVIKPFVTAEWWHKTLDVIEQLAREVACYTMQFDQSGRIIERVQEIVGEANGEGRRT